MTDPTAHVVPDDKWPGMWRIVWPDGKISDMVNLDRAKDAADVKWQPKTMVRRAQRHRRLAEPHSPL